MMNHITLMGRLTRDPELRHAQSGIPAASFSLAVSRDCKDKSTGEAATDFVNVAAWQHNSEFVSNYGGTLAGQLRFWQSACTSMISIRTRLKQKCSLMTLPQ